MRQATSLWRGRWLAWVSLGLMVVVTVGGLFYLATDWNRSYQSVEDDFYWSDLSVGQEEVDKPSAEEVPVDNPAPHPAAVPAAQPAPTGEVTAGPDQLAAHTDQEADPGPEPEIALIPVMAPAQAFADVARPVQAEVSSSFGWRKHPVFADWRYHPGVDIDASLGEEVKAVMAGTVVEVKQDEIWGKLVSIDHHGQRSSIYAHLDQVDVEVGQAVDKGQRIGTVGQTGITDQPHLHLELRLGGTAVDPALYLPPPKGINETAQPTDDN